MGRKATLLPTLVSTCSWGPIKTLSLKWWESSVSCSMKVHLLWVNAESVQCSECALWGLLCLLRRLPPPCPPPVQWGACSCSGGARVRLSTPSHLVLWPWSGCGWADIGCGCPWPPCGFSPLSHAMQNPGLFSSWPSYSQTGYVAALRSVLLKMPLSHCSPTPLRGCILRSGYRSLLSSDSTLPLELSPIPGSKPRMA